MIGFATVQIALLRGARVIATTGESFAKQLRVLGATVTPYGDGMIEGVRDRRWRPGFDLRLGAYQP